MLKGRATQNTQTNTARGKEEALLLLHLSKCEDDETYAEPSQLSNINYVPLKIKD